MMDDCYYQISCSCVVLFGAISHLNVLLQQENSATTFFWLTNPKEWEFLTALGMGRIWEVGRAFHR